MILTTIWLKRGGYQHTFTKTVRESEQAVSDAKARYGDKIIKIQSTSDGQG